jgi:hypothetical protein
MLAGMMPLKLAYATNISILVPIGVPTVFRLFPTDQGRFAESEGWRILVGALWTGILVLSVLGLFQPLRFSPVLLLQVIYKSIWLVLYALPRLVRGDANQIPWGIAGSFALIVLIWPFLIPWDYVLGLGER